MDGPYRESSIEERLSECQSRIDSLELESRNSTLGVRLSRYEDKVDEVESESIRLIHQVDAHSDSIKSLIVALIIAFTILSFVTIFITERNRRDNEFQQQRIDYLEQQVEPRPKCVNGILRGGSLNDSNY